MKGWCVFLVLCGQMGASLWAQPADAEKEAWLRRPVCFLLWEDIEETLWVHSDGAYEEIKDLSPYRRSLQLDYFGPAELVLYRKQAPPGDPEAAAGAVKDPYVPVGRVTLREELKKPLVMLIPRRRGPLEVTGMAFEDHPLDFPMGTYKMFNMTRRELAVGMNGEMFALAPGRSKMVDPKLGRNGVLEFQLLYRDGDGEAVIAQKTVFRYRVRRREIVFIKDHPDFPDRFQTHMVMEYLPPPTPPPEPPGADGRG